MAITRENFDYLRELLKSHSGNTLQDDKTYLLEARLAPLVRRFGCTSLDDLSQRLRFTRVEGWVEQIVEAMMIHETSFFRDGQPWEALRNTVLPELIERGQADRRLNIWSVACSTGQEPYSLAILLYEQIAVLRHWAIRVMASDRSSIILNRARAGVFSGLDVSRGLDATMRSRWFREVADGWEVIPEIKSLVQFFPLNLNENWPPLPLFDLILLRNVLIYFEPAARKVIVEKARRLLRPDGYLLLGTTETIYNVSTDFEIVFLNGVAFCKRIR